MPANEYASPKDSIEELYQDIFLTLLGPTIDSALEKQYGGWVPYDFSDIKVLSAERINPDGRTIAFTIKIDVRPYKGAHITIGKDQLTIEVLAGEKTKVIKFEHIKSYE